MKCTTSAHPQLLLLTLFLFHYFLQPSLLEGPMRDALLGDRPALVRLFVENGLDVGQILTWKQLEHLYAGAPEVSLLHQLLERRHGAGSEPIPPPEYLLVERSLPERLLPHVARILHELLGDVCAPFYAELYPDGHKGTGVGCSRTQISTNGHARKSYFF